MTTDTTKTAEALIGMLLAEANKADDTHADLMRAAAEAIAAQPQAEAAEALAILLRECKAANEKAVREIGMGLIDLNAISRAESALAASHPAQADDEGGAT